MGIGTVTEKRLCGARIAKLKMRYAVLGGTGFQRMSSTVRGEKGKNDSQGKRGSATDAFVFCRGRG